MIEEELHKLGFGEKKTALYLALLKDGKGSVADLAATAGIKRTTAYDLLEELHEENLATVSFSGKRRIFVVEPPENLRSLVKRQLSIVDRAVSELKELYNRESGTARVRYYEGADGIRYVHDELLKVKSGEYFYFGSMSTFEGALGLDYLKSFIYRRIRKKIWANAIRVRSHEIDDPLTFSSAENYRRVRYISKPLSNEVANLTLYDDKISVCSSCGENYAMIIESRETFNIMRFLWDFIWENAEE